MAGTKDCNEGLDNWYNPCYFWTLVGYNMKSFFYLILILVTLGLVFVADISTPQALNFFNDKFYFFKQQLVWAGVGLVAMIVVSNIHYSFWRKIAVPFFFISCLLLIIVLIPGIGLSALGARRWISVGTINFQPSEIVKLALALYLARVADSKNKKPLAFFVPLVLVCGLIMLQPDLGTTLVVGLLGIVQIFVSGVPIMYFLGSLFTLCFYPSEIFAWVYVFILES